MNFVFSLISVYLENVQGNNYLGYQWCELLRIEYLLVKSLATYEISNFLFLHAALPYKATENHRKSVKKRPKASTPEKGSNKCAVEGCALDERSNDVQCEKCNSWFCVRCLSMSYTEYDIFNRINKRLGNVWVRPLCKAGGSKRIVSDDVKSTLTEHRNKVQGVFDSFIWDMILLWILSEPKSAILRRI